ncbi:MAG: HAMP domain-containing histidine kinase [Proteobacteria bacterium]|nr:HAMP domain-containing histidine kinase [Pseudomonadota bacterium]
MKIFTKILIFFILGTAIPLVVSHHFAGLMFSRVLRDYAFDELSQSVGEAADSIEEKMDGTAAALSVVTETVPLADAAKEGLQSAVEVPFRQIAGITAVVLLDAEGRAVAPPYYPSANRPEMAGTGDVTEEDLAIFTQHIPVGSALAADVAVGPVYLSSSGTPRVAMAKSFALKDGRSSWILAVERGLDDICALVASYEYTESRSALVLDDKGRTVCGPGGQIPSRLLTYQSDHCSYKLQDTGLRSFEWMRDRSVQCSSRRVKRLGWWLFFEQDHGELAVSMSRQINWTLAWIIIAMVIAVIGGIIFSRALTRPLNDLHRGVAAITGGDYTKFIDIHSNDEVGSLANAFNHMTSEIRQWNLELTERVEERTRALKEAREQVLRTQKMAAVGELGSGVAHEINNPLTSAIGTAQLLKDKVDPKSEMANGLDDILDSCNRVAAVVDALLRFSQNQEQPGMEPVDIGNVIYDLFLINVVRLDKRHIIGEYDVEEKCRVMGYEPDLRLALSHLLDNAIQAMEDGGDFKIVAKSIEGGAVGITVSDTGKGMTEEVRLRVFDPFYSTRPVEEGSRGLGLSLVHRVVSDHNGRVVIDSEPGKGTTINIYLPGAAPLSRT